MLARSLFETLVTIGVELTKMNTVGDLQGGIEEAERQLGFKVSRASDADDQESADGTRSPRR